MEPLENNEKPMEEALKMVTVSTEIADALIYNEGKLAPVFRFMVDYETANWLEISREMILLNLDEDIVCKAYTDSLIWYRNLMSEETK